MPLGQTFWLRQMEREKKKCFFEETVGSDLYEFFPNISPDEEMGKTTQKKKKSARSNWRILSSWAWASWGAAEMGRGQEDQAPSKAKAGYYLPPFLLRTSSPWGSQQRAAPQEELGGCTLWAGTLPWAGHPAQSLAPDNQAVSTRVCLSFKWRGILSGFLILICGAFPK